MAKFKRTLKRLTPDWCRLKVCSFEDIDKDCSDCPHLKADYKEPTEKNIEE